MRISLHLLPIVLVSRLNSCTRKSIFLPIGKSASSIFLKWPQCELSLVISSSIDTLSE